MKRNKTRALNMPLAKIIFPLIFSNKIQFLFICCFALSKVNYLLT